MPKHTDTTLLLVEDEVIIAMAEAEQLRKKGYKVVTAHSGQAAVDTVSTTPGIDLILMDIDLGKNRMDGTAAAEEILSRYELPVVFLSSHTESEIVERTEKITSYGYVVKNSGFTVLDTSIKMALKLFAAHQDVKKHKKEAEDAYWEMERREDRLQHVNRILLSIRNVNQIITKEDDRKTLLQRACRLLIETSGYFSASIVLMEGGTPKEPYFHAGTQLNYPAMEEALHRGNIPACITEALQKDSIVIKNDARLDCPGCPLSNNISTEGCIEGGKAVMVSRLEYHGTVYGWIMVTLPAEYSIDPDENSLFTEVAGDLSYALHKIEIEERKQLLDGQLRDNEQLLDSVFESIQDGISVLDTDLTIRHTNNVMERWYAGQVPLKGKKCFSCYQGRSEACVPCPSLRSIESGQTERDIVQGPPGSPVEYIELYSYPIKDPGTGEVTGVVEFVRDITQRKRAELMLFNSKEHLKATLNSIGDGVFSTDRDGNITRMNPVAEQLTGWRADEAAGKACTEVFSIINAHSREKAENPVDKVLKTGTIVGLANHTVLVSKDGTEYQIADSASPIRDSSGEASGVVVVFRDVTEDYRIREQLKRNEDRLSKVLAAAQDGTWDWNLTTNDAYFGPRYYEMAGYEPDEFPHRLEEFQKRIDPQDLDRVMEAADRHLVGEIDQFNVEFRFRKKSGDWMWIQGRGKIVEWNDDGTPSRFVGTHTDISQRKETEKILTDTLEERNTLLKELKHRVKNNFSLIISMMRLKMGAVREQETKDSLEDMEGWVRVFSELYTQLYREDSLNTINLETYFRDLVESMNSLSDNITIDLETEDLSWPLKEAGTLGLVVTELVTNAVKHSFPDGRPGNINIRFEQKGQTSLLTVENDGLPFPAAFDPDRAEGLGLKIVRSMAEDMDGNMEILAGEKNGVAVSFMLTEG